jgi:two-component system response regulator RegA
LPEEVTLRILVVDDPIIVSAITAMSDAELDFDVIHADSVRAGLAAFRLHRPRVTVAGFSFADGSGLDLTREIHRVDPDARVVLLSMSNDRIFHERALQAGANSCLSKLEDPYLLIETLRGIAIGST